MNTGATTILEALQRARAAYARTGAAADATRVTQLSDLYESGVLSETGPRDCRILATGFDTLVYTAATGALPEVLAEILDEGRDRVYEGHTVVVRVGSLPPTGEPARFHRGAGREIPDVEAPFADRDEEWDLDGTSEEQPLPEYLRHTDSLADVVTIGTAPYGYWFKLARGGSNAGHAWKLIGDYFTICLSNSKHLPHKVEIGSLACWERTPRQVYEDSRDALSTIVGAKGWPSSISRVDAMVDHQGYTPPAHLAIAMVTRARTRRTYVSLDSCSRCGAAYPREESTCCDICSKSREHAAQEPAQGPMPFEPTWRTLDEEGFRAGGRRFTGWRWGSGKGVLARYYDKTYEIVSQSRKFWFHDVWKESGLYVEGQPVWRLEIQCRREWLHSLVLPGDKRLSTVEDLFENAASVWRYLTGEPAELAEEEQRARKGGWIELRAPLERPDPRPTRWPVHWLWKKFQTLTFNAELPAVPIARFVAQSTNKQKLAEMAVGAISSYASIDDIRGRLVEQHGEPPTGVELFHHAITPILENHAEKFRVSVEKKDAARARTVERRLRLPPASRPPRLDVQLPATEAVYSRTTGRTYRTVAFNVPSYQRAGP